MFGIKFAVDLLRNQRRQRKPVRLRPAVEGLESRLVPSTFNEFPVPGAHDQFGGAHITTGPDGNLWFTHNSNQAVGRITTQGSVAEFALPSNIDDQFGIANGPDGNLWLGVDHFSGSFPNNQTFILRLSPDGNQTYFRARPDDRDPNDFQASFYGPTVGPDGNLWYHMGLYSSPNEDLLGRITPDGTVTNFILGTPFQGFDGLRSAGGITAGADGYLWLSLSSVANPPAQIWRITPDGQLFSAMATTHGLGEMTAGPDGNVWGVVSSLIERITPGGSVTDFPLPTRTQLKGITAGPDGNVWFTEPQANQIGMITPDGQITEFQVPTPNSQPAGITAGPDGNIWFTELGSGQIGEFVLNGGGGAGGAASATSVPVDQAVRSAAVDALFANAPPAPLAPVVSNQQPVRAAIDAALSDSQRDAVTVTTEPQVRVEAVSLAHLHPGNRAVMHDLVGLTDPLTEAL
jgi:streptogramin lyase